MTSGGDGGSVHADDGDGAEDTPAARSWLAGLLELPQQALSRVAGSVARTPGRLAMIGAGLVTLSLLVGLVGTLMAQSKKDTVDELIDHREPLAMAAQQVYAALSDAEATAASEFLATENEPERIRERYERSIAQAGASLSQAATDAEDGPAGAERVETISTQLPVYAGLVETARAHNEDGSGDGASSVQDASELMRSTLLPAADDLYRIDTERLSAEQEEARAFPVVTVVLSIGLLAALVAAQLYLQRTTNRVFNRGLVVASAAVLVGLVWTSIALIVQGVQVNAGQRDGTQQVDLLADARITALQARADETLSLVARGDGQHHDNEFARLATELAGSDGAGGLLGRARDNVEDGPAADHVADAIDSADSWLRAHDQIRARDGEGDYADAVELAIDVDEDGGSAAAFSALDESLESAIEGARQSFFDHTISAARALTLLPAGLAALGAIAALGVMVGVGERLREYR